MKDHTREYPDKNQLCVCLCRSRLHQGLEDLICGQEDFCYIHSTSNMTVSPTFTLL